MSLIRIPSDVTKKISACSDINSFKKAVEELVYNAFDAKSTSIAIRVFIQECSVQVIDNGCGISHQDFKFLGCRYMTSKFKNGSEEELIQNYGYRGLSLASIIDVSHNVKITSRCSDTENTFSKTFVKGKEQDILETSKRPSKGTTVEISGFLYNLHIQKNIINPLTEIAHIKKFLEQISLVHCSTSISLRDDSTHEIFFKISKHRDINQTLLSLFEIESKDVQELIVEKNDYKIHGFIEKTVEEDKKYHFIYINGRYINISRLHDSINKKLRSNDSTRITKTNKENFKGEKIISKKIPFYFIFIKCPQSDYDINHTSEQSIIEFKNWEKIDKLLDKLVKFYNGDLKVKKLITRNDIKERNIDTRKQVEQIMHKILGNNSKKTYGLHLKTGIKGKNIKRKQKNKAHDMSISKIVSKQLKCQLSKFNKKYNICESKNDFEQKDIFAASSPNNINYLSIRNKTHNETEYSQNKQDISQENVRKIQRISQDPLNIKFKNPTDTVLRRFDTLRDQLKYFIPIRKKYIANKVSNKKYVANYTLQKQGNFVIKPNYISEVNSIKTSYDLVKSIFRGNKFFELDLASKSGKNKQSITKRYFDTEYTVRKRYKHKLSYESHNYVEAAPPKRERKFISNSSCNNFKIHEPKEIKSLINKKNKKRNYFIDNNYPRQETKNKCKRDSLNTNLIQSTLHTIETIESHYDKEFRESNNFKDKSYYSHRLTYQAHASNLQRTYNSKEFFSSNIRTGCDIHTTYTIDISNNKNNYHGQDKGFETHEEIILDNAYYKNANIVFVSEPNSKKLSPLVNPLQVCETNYNSSENLDNSNLGVNGGNKTMYNIKDSSLNFNNHKEISQYFTNKENISRTDNTIDTNIGGDTIISNKLRKNVSIRKEVEKSISSKENIETDTIETNKEGFKLNSRFNFIPKGMSQITEIPLPKTTSYRDLEENYYENDIYENFATNLQIYSEVLEPGVQNLNDIAMKGSVCKQNNENMNPIFDVTSLKEAKVLGQVDLKFIAAKVIGKYSKTNIETEFLVLFDQHAVDERIKLENNLSDYFDGEKWSSITLDLHLRLSKESVTYLHNYRDKFTRFGLKWSFKEHVVCIKSIPKAILGKNSRQIDVIMKAVKSLIYEQIEAIKSLKGNVSLHPKSIMNLVSIEACRYAIKFGDKVTKSECQDLLKELSTCKLPFQCAHGRPVMAVMIEIPVVNYDYKINMDKIKKIYI